ncbi:MAG: hypothetical protein JNK44_06355 [Cyclobacteriaceae bacterium]|nr:hypothetical protein [Cyclobacteriaceae bacterium]
MKEFLFSLKERTEVLFYFGLICLFAAVCCLVLTKTSMMQVLGTSAWFKPFKFFLSSAIFVWSMGWYLHYLGNSPSINWYSWGMVALLGIENLYITMQAARGLASHFNVTTPSLAMMWSVMAGAAVAISIWTAVVSFPFFTQSFPLLPTSYVWGIRLGLIVFVIFSLQGLTMGARMAHTVGGLDGGPGLLVVNWSTLHGDLRVAHFMGMHGLQVLPLLGFFVLRKPIFILIAGVFYVGTTTGVFLQAILGRPFLKL